MNKEEIEKEMLKYFDNNYNVDYEVIDNQFNCKQVNFKNKKLFYPYCKFWLGYGMTPDKLLLFTEIENKKGSGMSGAINYKGLESVDFIMKNIFEISKGQLKLF